MRPYLASAVFAVLAAPCVADGVYIGRMANGPDSARIAIVEAGGRFVCYSCSSDASFNEKYSRWLQGSVGAKGETISSSSGVSFHATFAKGVIKGGLQTAEGEAIEFLASRVEAGAEAGLFRYVQLTDDERLVDGWIVDEDGEVVGGRKKTARKRLGEGREPKQKVGEAAAGKAAGSNSAGKKPGRAAVGVGSSSAKKKQPVLSSKKLGDRLKTAGKKKADGIANGDGTAKAGTSKKEGVGKTGTSKKEGDKAGTSVTKGVDKTGTAGKTAKAETNKAAGTKGKKKTDGANDSEAGDEKVAAGEKKGAQGKGTGEEGVNQGAKEKVAGVGKKQGKQGVGQQGGQKQQGAEAGEEENAGVAAAEAAEENQPQVAANVGNQKQKQQQLGQQQVGKIRNVEEINIIEEDEDAADDEDAAPQEVDVENVRVVNRIKANNQPAGQQNQNNNAPAPLPGEVVEGTLVGVDDEDRVLTVDDGQEVVEVPIGNRQMIVIDENGERAAEQPANAAAQGALKGKPGQMLKKLAESGDTPVRVRIGAKNVVVKQQAQDE